MTTQTHTLGFRQLDPIPNDDRLEKFYESEYYHLIKAGGRANELRRLMEGGETAESELSWLRGTLYQDCLDAITTHSAGALPILDIGCGTGNLVLYLSANGLDARGIEPSAEATSIARERELKVREATLETLLAESGQAGSYRALTLLNVLEHVPDPARFVQQARGLLGEGGLIIIRVPNDFSRIQEVAQATTTRKQWWVAVPDHINYFDKGSLAALLAQEGFEVVDLYSDFPMELFILMGINYVDNPKAGENAHEMRRSFELNIPKDFRRALYRKLTEIDIGRNLFVVGRQATRA